MESVKNWDEVGNLENNQVLGNNFELINSEIKFLGANNILYCEGNVKLVNTYITFAGNNSIIYLSYTSKEEYSLNVIIKHDSTIFIGKNNEMGFSVNINIQEHQNLIIGDDNIIGNNVTMRTCDTRPIYDVHSKNRKNFSESIFIGDHVWIDHFTYIPSGAKIGSGAIVGIYTILPPYHVIESNTYSLGNPAKTVDHDIFFTNEFTGRFNSEDTLNFTSYESDVFCYDYVHKETLSMDNIDKIIKDLNVYERLEFIQKLFVQNKRKNRFSIKK